MPGNTTQRTVEEVEAELEALTPPEEQFDTVEEEADTADDDTDTDASAEEEAAAAAAATATAHAEQEAGRKGWVPKDRFNGDPAKWVDAKTFLERGERFTANLQREIVDLRKKVEDFEGTKAAFAKFYTEQLERKDRELKAAIAELRIRRSEAIQDGEHDTAVELEDRIDLLKEQQTNLRKDVPKEQKAEEPTNTEKPAREAGPIVDPVIMEWIEDGNTWFDEDPRLRAFAIAAGDQLINNGETARGRKLLDKIAGIVKEEFPRKFRQKEPPTTPPASLVEGDTPRKSAGGSAGKTERDLPPEDFKLMKQFIADGLTTKEAFLKSYFA